MKRRVSEGGITRRALLRTLGAVGLAGVAAPYLVAARPVWAQGNLASQYEGNADVRFS
jgi:hypothetical protein